jgi:hypothetical protein
MFQGATKFNKDLNTWNVNKVTGMIAIFNEAANFDQPLNSWNVSRVTSMESMFGKANNFNQPLNGWDVGKVNNMLWMFYDASSFDQSLNGWNVSKVIFMCNSSDGWPYGMFEQASSYNQPLNAWDVSKVKNFDAMFYSAARFNQDICSWGDIPTSTSQTTSPIIPQLDMDDVARKLDHWVGPRPPKPIVWYGKKFPYNRVSDMFSYSGCTYKDSPNKSSRGPFCASVCIKNPTFSPTVYPTFSPTVSQSPSSSTYPTFSPTVSQSPSSSTYYPTFSPIVYPTFSPTVSQSPSSSQSPSYNWDDDNLYSNSNKSPNEPIANESHQVSVQATALARAKKPTLQTCWNKGTNKCPIVPGKIPTTAPSCRC